MTFRQNPRRFFNRRWLILLLLLAVTVLLYPAHRARAQPPPLLALYPWQTTELAYTWDEPLFENKGYVRNDGKSFHLFWYDSYGRFRISRATESPTFGYRLLTIDLGNHSPLLPEQLTDNRMDIGWHLFRLGHWDVGAIAGVGYDGNSPFDQTNAVYGLGHIQFSRAIDRHDKLALTLDYSGFHSLLPDTPLPGFAIEHDAPGLHFKFGYPRDSINWKPLYHLDLSARYTVPFSGMVQASYALFHRVSVYGLYRNYFEGFHIRTNFPRDQRLFFEMDRAEVGLRYSHGSLIDISLGIGYAFNQNFSRGFDVRSLQPVASISNEPYVVLLLRGQF